MKVGCDLSMSAICRDPQGALCIGAGGGGGGGGGGESAGSASGAGGEETGLCLDTQSEGLGAEGFAGQHEWRGTHALSQLHRQRLAWGEGKVRVSLGYLVEVVRVKHPVHPNLQTERGKAQCCRGIHVQGTVYNTRSVAAESQGASRAGSGGGPSCGAGHC